MRPWWGVGWAFAGGSPAPAFVAVGSGALWAIVFVAAMLAGAWLESLRYGETSATKRPSPAA